MKTGALSRLGTKLLGVSRCQESGPLLKEETLSFFFVCMSWKMHLEMFEPGLPFFGDVFLGWLWLQ